MPTDAVMRVRHWAAAVPTPHMKGSAMPRTLSEFQKHQTEALDAIDEALTGSASLGVVAKALSSGFMEDEAQTIALIKMYLRTPEQKQKLSELHLSLEDVLNGRVGAFQERAISSLFNDWNQKLGIICFSFDGSKLGQPYTS